MQCERAVMATVGFNDMPCEILTAIFAFAVQLQFHPTSFHDSQSQAIRDLLTITHLNSRFRDIAIHESRLWTMVPALNVVHEDLFELMLIRSVPLPFCFSFIEDATLPSEEDTKSWMLVGEHIRRLGFLSIQVATGFCGLQTKTFLRKQFPALQKCMVQFHGDRCVRLGSRTKPLFDNYAPRLRTLDLTNCDVSPGRRCPPTIESMAIRCLPPANSPTFLSLDKYKLWMPQFKNLRNLVIWDCCTEVQTPMSTPRGVEFPQLRNLVVATSVDGCSIIASSFTYPEECSCSVTVLLPRVVGTQDAESGALAALAFLRDGLFDECHIDVNDALPSIRFIQPRHHSIILKFWLHQVTVEHAKGGVLTRLRGAILRIVSLTTTTSSLDPLSTFSYQLWDILSGRLSGYLKNVSTLRMVTSTNRRYPQQPLSVLPLFPRLPRLSVMFVESPELFRTNPFLPVALPNYAFLELRKVVVKLTHPSWDASMKECLSGFLKSMVDRGSPVQEVLFVISPRMTQALGFASSEGVRLAVCEIGDEFPPCISVSWMEL